jgi:Rrf2 family protein
VDRRGIDGTLVGGKGGSGHEATLPAGPATAVSKNGGMRVTAKVDYAVRAATVLADAAARDAGPVKGDRIASAQDIPVKYLENILSELRQAGILRSQRGAEGGYWLARPASEISLADIIRAVEGPLANVRGERPEELTYPQGAGALQGVWIATRAALRSVLEQVTLAHVAADRLPDEVARLIEEPDAWEPH